jgi:hypothetical protein
MKFKIGLLIAMIPGIGWADIYTVGPDGAYPTIPAAVNVALMTAGAHEVRLQSGNHVASLNFNAISGTDIEISGGWNSSFTVHSEDPTLTDWRAAINQPVLVCGLSGTARIRIARVRMNNGISPSQAGGVNATLANSSLLDLLDVHIESNSTGSIVAAGLNILTYNNSVFTLDRAIVAGNIATGSSQQIGIGMRLATFGNSVAFVNASQFFSNVDNAGNTATFGAGIYADAYDDSFLTIADSQIHSHELLANIVSGSALSLNTAQNAAVSLQRLTLRNNRSVAATLGNRSQASIAMADASYLQFKNSSIARGNHSGLVLNANTTGSADLANLTIASHPDLGIAFSGSVGGGKSFYNSIVHGNQGASFGTDVVRSANLGSDINGVNPLFVTSFSNLRLQPGSPAIDAGNAVTPAGDLGLFDLEMNPRVSGSSVDIGAYEFLSDAIFLEGFES